MCVSCWRFSDTDIHSKTIAVCAANVSVFCTVFLLGGGGGGGHFPF